MPNLAANFSSEYLTADQMELSLKALPAVLRELFGECTFKACYGYGANLDGDIYVPMAVQTSALPGFIKDSIDQGIIIPGESDLFIWPPQNELLLLYCHESDIHVDGESLNAMQRFMSAEPYCKMRFYSQAELRSQYPYLSPGT